ncbi:MAG: hypothetical protein HOZ81_02930 [Streptomyces sp.]|nr:hypothetical protein [Streptomyces sp.]
MEEDREFRGVELDEPNAYEQGWLVVLDETTSPSGRASNSTRAPGQREIASGFSIIDSSPFTSTMLE